MFKDFGRGDMQADCDIEKIDDSFDHEFGTQNVLSVEAKNITFTVWIDGVDYTFAESQLPDDLKQHLERELLEEYRFEGP
jgi:hypothetical protein